jgi:RND superfamily putative drug exporter
MQMFGVGVAIAIILDALIVRPVLLPAAASLLGRWSWWPLSRQAPPAPPRTPTDRRGITDVVRWQPGWRRTA